MKPILLLLLLFLIESCREPVKPSSKNKYLSFEFALSNIKPKEIESDIEKKNRFNERNSVFEKKFNDALDLYKGKRFLESVGKFEEAMDDFTEPEIYYHYAKSLKSIGSFPESLLAFEIAEKLNYENKIYLYYNRASVYSLLSDLPRSVYFLKLAISNGFHQFKHFESDSDFSFLKKQKYWDEIFLNIISDKLLIDSPEVFLANPNRKIKLKRFSKTIFLDTKEYSVRSEMELFNEIIFFNESSTDKEGNIFTSKSQGLYKISKDRIQINFNSKSFLDAEFNRSKMESVELSNLLSFELIYKKDINGFILMDSVEYDSKDFIVNKKDCSLNKEVGCESCRKEYVQKGYFCTY